MKTNFGWLLKLLTSPQMTMTDDTTHKDLLIAAAPRMLAALEVCAAYMWDNFPYPTRKEARAAADIAIAHAIGKELVGLDATPTERTTHYPDGRITIEKIDPSSYADPPSDWTRPEITGEKVEQFLASFENLGLLFGWRE